ncbi:unnamed protein product [Prorocentrum cordatum]|uniref:CCHC-type domain-containing protein n=1 Tax=Prorocentrum cordatum TaxID=2364126 RepID=A0ABN9PVC0_9DINO|nr:unnamed protein product [Polarella glacialis]
MGKQRLRSAESRSNRQLRGSALRRHAAGEQPSTEEQRALNLKRLEKETDDDLDELHSGEFRGKDADWPRWSPTVRAHLGAVSGRMLELIQKAESFDEGLDRVDLDPGDDQLDAQLYVILTMPEFEPKFASRKMALQQAYLSFTFNKDEDPRKGIDRLETQIRQYQADTKKTVDDDTRTGVLLKALAGGSELQKKLGDHLVLNAYRVDTFIEMKREIQEYLGVKQWLVPGGSAEVLAVGAGDKTSQKNQVKGELKIKFAGDCYCCGKPGHKKVDCWLDIAAIEEQMRALSLSIGALKDQDCGSVELCRVSETQEVGMVHAQTATNRVTMGLDSGAEVTVWPPELFPQVATEPLLAMCSMMDGGHDLHFKCGGRCYAKHCKTGKEIEITRGVPAMMAPNLPTPEERARHEIDHMPYAAWCRSCVAGKGKADPHFLKTSDDLGVQGVACDYCFMGDAVESDKATDKCLPILVHNFYGDRWVSARVVPRKGPETYAVKATVDDVMQSLKQEVVKKLRKVAGPVDVILEESSTSESQQNAVVERAIWEVQSTARTLVHACLEHHRVQVPLKHPLRIYAVEYAGQLLNRSQPAAKDSRTACEIRKGKTYRRKLPPFGEAVMYMPMSTARRRRKFEDRWETGIYLGLVERSNMLLVGTPRGVFKVNCVKRLPEIQSSDPELLKSIVGVPWDPVPGEPGPRFDIESKKPIVDEVRQEHHQTDDQGEHRFYDQAKSQERRRRRRVAPRRRTSQGARRKRVAPRWLTLGDSRGAPRKRVAPRRRTLGASRIRQKRVAPCRLAVQARLRHPLEQKRVAPHCGEVAEVVGELMHLGAAIGPRLQEAIQQPSKDDVDVIESEKFCRKRFTDQASWWGVHPGVALDLTTGWDLDDQTHVEQHVKAGRAAGWLTNSGCIAEELTKLQGNDNENATRSAGAVSPAAENRPAIVAAVLRGLRRQLQQDGAVSINALEPGLTGHDTQEWDEDGLEQFFDELTGERLRPKDVREVKVKEIEFLRTFPVYEEVPEAMAKGKRFISTRWTITNKGDVNAPDVRARFVGREFKWKSPAMENTFAATPPLEQLKYLLSRFQSRRRGPARSPGERKILVLDVSRAHFHPKCRRELYIRLPEEDAQAGFAGRLMRTLYGTRDAAKAWDEFFNEAIVRREYEVGLSSPCLYYCAAEDSAGWRHGDDLVFEGPDEWLDWLGECLRSVMILKRRAKLGWDTADDKHVTILNGLVDSNDASRDRPSRIDAYADGDRAQDPDRKSASCVVTMHGAQCLRVQVATQTAPALSSGEAEFVAQVKGGSTAIGMRSMIRDMGGQVSIDLHTDSTAGKGIASRVGLGKVRHLDTGLLWLQHHVNRRDLRIKKVH